MMKVNFLKRLESSVYSFDLTLKRTIQKMDDLKARIQRFQQFQAANPDLDFDELTVEDVDDEELIAAFEVSKARFKLAHLDLTRWLADLRRDQRAAPHLWSCRRARSRRSATPSWPSSSG